MATRLRMYCLELVNANRVVVVATFYTAKASILYDVVEVLDA